MSISYLQSVLPVPTTDNEPSEIPEYLADLSEHQLGVLSARFESFRSGLLPFKEQLVPIEKYLSDFSAEIERLSESLHSLQSQSLQLSQGLQGYQDLVNTLNPLILDLAIPPAVAQSVLSAPINEKWVENTTFIAEKQQLAAKIAQGSLSYTDSKAFVQLQKGLEILEAKAIERIRNHVIEQIRLLRQSVKTPSQLVQERLLQVKEVFAFLKERHPQLAKQLQLAYIYTMKWYYTTRFAKYLYSLQKLKLKHIDSSFVLGGTTDHGEQRSGLFGLYGAVTPASSGSASPNNARVTLAEYISSVPKRMAVLGDGDDSKQAIPAQIAETTPFFYWLEFAFAQFSNALHDNIIVEYLFVTDFFYQGSEVFDPVQELDSRVKVPESAKDWSHLMFDEVYQMGQQYAMWLLTASNQTLGARIASGSGATYAAGSTHSGSYDGFAVLLMIRIVQKHSYSLHNQFHVPVMDEYHNRLLLSLWPQFTKVIDLNCDSLKKNILGSSSYSYGSSDRSSAPIQTTQQFAQFITGLMRLAFLPEQGDKFVASGEPICMSIVRLRNDFESALTKASSHIFGSSKKKGVQKEMFLFNNYFLIMTILRNEFEEPNEFVTEQIQHFELLCDAFKPK